MCCGPNCPARRFRLIRVPRSVLPEAYDTAELDALLALMLLQHSRRDARVRAGRLVLLPDQDRSRWRHDEITEALDLLTPLADAPPTPYLLQALIAALSGVALPGHRLPAARAELLSRTADLAGALRSYDAAIALCANDAERAHLIGRRDAVAQNGVRNENKPAGPAE
jgi:RNA polymerase sigma-70 factor (ECF subfamily)